MMTKFFPIIFWKHNKLLVCQCPYGVDYKEARKRIGALVNVEEKKYKFKIMRSDGKANR